jgi:hypothetical protein
MPWIFEGVAYKVGGPWYMAVIGIFRDKVTRWRGGEVARWRDAEVANLVATPGS